MGKLRTAGALAAPALATAGVVGLGPAPHVGAQAPPPPIFGDLDNDGIADRARLLDTTPCTVSVEPGLPGGGYGPAVAHSIDIPPDDFGGTPYCPDRGVVVDLGGDGVNELVLAWFSGPTGPVGGDIIVMRDYVQVGAYDLISRASYVQTVDLNGDGLDDVYSYNSDGEGFASLLNTPSGALVPGPLRHSHPESNHALADFDEDGSLDLAVRYGDRFSEGLEVILDDGTTVPIAGANLPPRVVVGDANDDGHVDVAVQYYGGGGAVIWLGDGHGGFTPK